MSLRRCIVTGLALAATCVAVPNPAHAASGSGTITYTLDGNVWITTPDGQVKRQLTKDGAAKPWIQPAMAPDGSVFAIQGPEIVHLAPDGAVLSRVTPTPLRGPGGVERSGVHPEWVAPSPGGTKLAWGSDWYACSDEDPECKFSSISGVMDVDRPTAVDKYGQAPSFRHASWITDTRLIGTENSTGFWANLWDLGSAPTRWFDSYDHLGLVWDIWEPDVAPNRKLVAMTLLRPNQRGLIAISRSATDLASGTPGMPTALCGISETLRADASPSWSPDGLELAYADPKGVQVNTWPREIATEQDCVTPEPRTITPAGARSPDWGAAEPLRQTPVPTPTPSPTPPPGGTPPGGAPPGGTPPGGTPPGGGSPPGGGNTPPGGDATPPAKCVVPKTKAGASLKKTQASLAGCRVKLVRAASRTVKKGRVIRLSRKATTSLPAGAKVTIYVSRGRR